MKRFILAPAAAADLEDIWQHIAEDSVDAAERFLEKLHENIRLLARTPGIGHSRKDLVEDRALLFWPVGNYLIVYRPAKRPIEIVAIAHGRRDIPTLVQRRQL